MAYQTEYPFTLPRGYMDESGTVHREGTMRFATAADEILPLRDPRVQQNPAYLSVVLMTCPLLTTRLLRNSPRRTWPTSRICISRSTRWSR